MRTSGPSPRRAVQVILGLLIALILAAGPAIAQNPPGAPPGRPPGVPPGPPPGGPPGQPPGRPPAHHDRSNPLPLTAESGPNFSVVTVAATADGAGSAVASVGQRMVLALRTGTLATPAGRPISPESQQTVLGALSPDGNADVLTLLFALTSNGNEHAKKPAKKLIEALPGASETPDRLSAAVKAFNSLVDASSTEFLANPPAEFLAIQAVLAPMAQEAILASTVQP